MTTTHQLLVFSETGPQNMIVGHFSRKSLRGKTRFGSTEFGSFPGQEFEF